MKNTVIIVSIVIVLVSLGVPSVITEIKRTKGLYCTSNLREIDAAKEQAAQALGLKEGDTVTEEQVAKYCRGNAIPQCPSNGKYTLDVIGQNPKCSLGNPKAQGERNWWHRLSVGIEQ
jgi:hypothetical protein